MTREQIEAQIRNNMLRACLPIDDIRVQEDAYKGWRVAVVSPSFETLSQPERHTVALDGLDTTTLAWVDLLTPVEREWAGALPLGMELPNQPFWPEALARGKDGSHQPDQPVFPSDLDEDLEKPVVATFYSMKGGVGRSTCLGYTGRLLAQSGHKVVCVDMDFEAPGLVALFGKEAELRQGVGVVDLLIALDQGVEPDFAEQLIRVDDTMDLFLVPAGQPDADYARRLRLLSPTSWYGEEKNPLRLLVEGLSHKLPFRPDVLLLDSRTGLSELSAPLLFDLADIAVIVFFPHPQSRTGTAAITRGLLATRRERRGCNRPLATEPRFVVSPVPSRTKDTSQSYRSRALTWIAEWLAPANTLRQGQEQLLESDITHFVPYREDLATSDNILREPEIERLYVPVADWIERFLPQPSEEPSSLPGPARKEDVLQSLSFPLGTAERQQDLLQSFVETRVVSAAKAPDVPLVLGRKGTGKTALFRRLTEDPNLSCAKIHAPADLRESGHFTPDAFKAVDQEFVQSGRMDWRQFWGIYCALGIARTLKADQVSAPPDPIQRLVTAGNSGPASVLDVLSSIVDQPRFGLQLNDWLSILDNACATSTLLLFDGLDTGFGSSGSDRDRRTQALQGLFSFLLETGPSFHNLKLKILLREDIWRKLRFENKSHLFGRAVPLRWDEQASFYKVILKHALRSEGFAARVAAMLPTGERLAGISPDRWPEDDVFAVWNVLVGERMKGGKTAFTRNWVWNRLADANDDHTPRYLLQLFSLVVEWEQKEQQRVPFERTVVRPRALIDCLPRVSEQALGAIEEEFPELEPLLNSLREIGRTPVPAVAIVGVADSMELAREVGLLSVYEGTEDQVQKYKVPEIYRHALGMTRKGQA